MSNEEVKVVFEDHLHNRKVIPERPLSIQEKELARFLIQGVRPSDSALLEQVDQAVVWAETGIANPTIDIRVKGAARRSSIHEGHIEGETAPNELGSRLNVLLWVEDGYLTALELFNDDGSPIQEIPPTSSITPLIF